VARTVTAAYLPPAPERYVLKDFRGSSHRILAGWLRELPAGTRIIELGAATGHLSALVSRADLEWLALESEINYLGELRKRFSGAAIVDVDRLSRLPRGYDVMIAADVLEHLLSPERTLRMVHEALRPGGRLLVSVPNVAHLYVRLALLFGRFPYADRGILDRTHRVFFSRHSARELLAGCGFGIEREAVTTVPLPLAFPHWPAWLLRSGAWLLEKVTRAFPQLFGYQFLVSARRL
jgi:2-polyprenyl-3-methyl-5-hydroxy-6-metoxy-1,4-benzoquinol methylase